jgi:hypothetical protein
VVIQEIARRKLMQPVSVLGKMQAVKLVEGKWRFVETTGK